MRRPVAIAVLAASVLLVTTTVSVWGARVVAKPADHAAGWHWLHGREAVEDLDSCRECHDEFACRACHLAEWPHAQGWQAAHGTEASRVDGRGCYLCHRAFYCDPCHGGVRMPHPEGFFEEHPRGGYAESACAICHVQADCDPCHRSHAGHQAGGFVLP